MQDNYGKLARTDLNMQLQLISTFPTKNLTLEIAWKGKNNVFVAASMPWSQLMVPRRER